METKIEFLIKLKNVFFLELIDDAKINKNKKLTKFLMKNNRKSGGIAAFNFLVISNILFYEDTENSNQKIFQFKESKLNFNDDEIDNFIIKPVDLNKNQVNAEIYSFYHHEFLPKLNLQKVVALQLLISDLSKLNKEEFYQTMIKETNSILWKLKKDNDQFKPYTNQDFKSYFKFLEKEFLKSIINDQEENLFDSQISNNTLVNENLNNVDKSLKQVFNFSGIGIL